jgi:ATP-dependent Lhr-like helicase
MHRWKSDAPRRWPSRRWLDPESAAQFGQLDAAAIEAVRAEARPAAESADELHDALMLLGVMDPGRDAAGALEAAFAELVRECRATELRTASAASGWRSNSCR